MMAILSSLSVAIFLAVLTLCLCHRLSYIFTPGPVMSRAVAELSPFLAAVMVLNGIAPVLTGVAVGCGWQAFVGYINIGCYYFLGIPLGCVLGFRFEYGVKGLCRHVSRHISSNCDLFTDHPPDQLDKRGEFSLTCITLFRDGA